MFTVPNLLQVAEDACVLRVYIRVCMCVYMRMYVCVCVCVYAFVYACVCVCVCARV